MVNTYLIMRKVKYFDFDEPRFFIGSTNPNRNLLEIGAKVIIEKEWNAEIRFIGHAEIEVIKENLNATDNRKGEQIVELTNFEKFFPPRIKNAEIRSLLNMLPGYRWYDSIRPINKEIFESDSIDPFRLVADYHEAKYSDEKKAHFASVYRKTIECPDTALPAQL